MNRGWRFCRFRSVLYLVDSSCSLVSGVDGLDVPSAVVLVLFGEHVPNALKDNENSFAFNLLERLHDALHVDGAKLMERNETRATLKAA